MNELNPQTDLGDGLAPHDLERHDLEPYEAVLLMSFGGPEAPEEVMPFLRRVTAGRGVPDERLAVVAEHYHAHGGRSPINDQCRSLIAALQQEMSQRQLDVEILWGNRNSAPYVTDVLAEAHRRGLRRLVMVTTSAYPSYSSCRQYREDIAAAVPEGMTIDRIGPYALTPGFIAANAAAVRRALAELQQPRQAHVLFVTHSIPDSMAVTAGPASRPPEGSYVAWHRRVAAQTIDAVRADLTSTPKGPDTLLTHELVYCSRSGSPSHPWLEPDVNDRLTELAGERDVPVILAPIGFISDHMEVIHDLDTEALQTAAEAGLRCVRADTAGVDPQFVAELVDLLLARAKTARRLPSATEVHPSLEPTAAQASDGPGWAQCPDHCCVNQRRPDLAAVR